MRKAALLVSSILAIAAFTTNPVRPYAMTSIETKLQRMLPESPEKRQDFLQKIQQRIVDITPEAQNGNANVQHELATWYLLLGDFDSALHWFSAAAQQGHKSAQKVLSALEASRGSTRGNPLLYEWARAEASNGNAEAQYQLGNMLIWGRNSAPRDIKQAQEWLQKAAKQGHVLANYQLGKLYLGGLVNNTPDIDSAIPLIAYAASANHVAAMRQMAELYIAGLGVEKNEEKALELFLQAGESGDIASLYDAAVMIDNGQGTPTNPALAIELYTRAAENGHTPSQLALANLYLSGGESFDRNEKKAAEWLARAAESGSAQAMYLLSSLYNKGLGVEQNIHKSNKWLKEAAKSGYPDAQYALSRKYLSGDGLPPNRAQAAAWADKAAQLGHARALNDAAYYAFHGIGTDQDLEKAFKYASLAIKSPEGSHFPDSWFILGVMAQLGTQSTPPDITAAAQFFSKAATLGHPEAHLNLAYMANSGKLSGTTDPAKAFKHAWIANILLPPNAEDDRQQALKIISSASALMDTPTVESIKSAAENWLSELKQQSK